MQCIACLASQTEFLYFDLHRCQKCGHVFYANALTTSDVKKIYSPEYFRGEEYIDYVKDKNIITTNFNKRLQTLLSFVQNPEKKKLLEIGSAYGFFLDLAQKYFAQTDGVEISTEAIEYSRLNYGHDIKEGAIEEMDFAPASYDVVCLWDTIEHLVSPDKVVSSIFEILKSEGIIAFTTGDISSLNAKVRGKNWRLIHPPSHVHYFTPRSAEALLNRLGFEIIHMSRPGYYRSFELILYRLIVSSWKMPKIYNFLKEMGLTKLQLYLNLFDIMFIIARKKS